MRNKKKNQNASFFDGILLIDKPKGCTSHDVVAKVRRSLHTRAVGHSGTLDPLASGLLIVLVGQATKLSDYLLAGDKGYEVVARLGVKTDTFDLEGQVTESFPEKITVEKFSDQMVDEIVEDLTGEIELAVPMYSAVKKDGKKLYEYAREGQEVEIPTRVTEFFDVSWERISDEEIKVRLSCSKGGYIRSWVHELGLRLGCGATVSELRRVFSQPYEIDRAISLENLDRLGQAFIKTEEGYTRWNAKGRLENHKELVKPFSYFLEDLDDETARGKLEASIFGGDSQGDNDGESHQTEGDKAFIENSGPGEKGSRMTELVSTLKGVIPISKTLPDWEKVTIDSKEERLLGNGQISRELRAHLLRHVESIQSSSGVKVLSRDNGRLVALIGNEQGKGFFIRRVFPAV